MNNQQQSGCLGFIFRLFGPLPSDKKPASDMPYCRKEYLLTKAERSFFGVLCQALNTETYWIFAKVRMSDLLSIQKGTDSRQSHFNRITSKHIDFVVCDRDYVRPLLAIELDDKSHNRPKTQERDKFVEAAFKTAGLPLLRVHAQAAYNLKELQEQIQSILK